MKTLLFTLEYPPFNGGVANYYCNIVKYWLEPNDISVLHNNNNNLIQNWLWPKWLPAFWHLWRAIKKQKIKHILVGHILPLGTVVFLVTKLNKTPYSVFLHGMDFTYALRSQRKKWLAKRILNNAKYIICGNSYTAGLVKKFVGDKQESKVGVVNPGIDVHVTCNMEHITQIKDKYNLHNKIVLFSIGRLVKRKGFDKVIESMPDVLEKIPNLVYIIAGAGPDKEYLKKKSGNLAQNARGKIIFLGKISDEDKWAWLNLCDIFIMPARNINGDFEGFGIVYLEANLCNKPVIAGNSGGARDAVEDYVNGILVDPESADSIADGIVEFALCRRLRDELGGKGWKRAIEKFNWEIQVKKIHKIINFVIL